MRRTTRKIAKTGLSSHRIERKERTKKYNKKEYDLEEDIDESSDNSLVEQSEDKFEEEKSDSSSIASGVSTSEESKEEFETNPNNLKPTEEWLADLKKFLLEKIVPLTTSNKDLYGSIVSKPAMNIWKAAFTSETFDANKGNNYEELEKLGDKVIGLNFILYLMDKYPHFTRRELSEVSSYYLSKKELSKISHKLGLSSMARSYVKGINLEEDLFESLFGALFIIGDKFIVEGAGNILCKKLLYNIFSEVKIDLNVTKGKPKTQVIEIFRKAGWGDVIIEWDEKKSELTLRFTPKAMKSLKDIGIRLPNDILAQIVKNTKTAAEEEAFSLALQRLNQFGINKSNVKEVLQIAKGELSNPELRKYASKIMPILKEKGISDIRFSKPSTRNKQYIVQLIGVKRDTDEKVTLANGIAASIIEAKKNALENFLNTTKHKSLSS
jgi:dsRNA-specific ribonuclease